MKIFRDYCIGLILVIIISSPIFVLFLLFDAVDKVEIFACSILFVLVLFISLFFTWLIGYTVINE